MDSTIGWPSLLQNALQSCLVGSLVDCLISQAWSYTHIDRLGIDLITGLRCCKRCICCRDNDTRPHSAQLRVIRFSAMAWYSPLLGGHPLVCSHKYSGHPCFSTYRDCGSDPSRCILFCPFDSFGVPSTSKLRHICLSVIREFRWLGQRRCLMVHWIDHLNLRTVR